jgi:uncharacterized protein (DUF433 family)
MDIRQQELLKRITLIHGLMGGKPTIRGLRMTVTDILEMLSNGMTPEEIIIEHPSLEKDDVLASIYYASLKLSNTSIIHAA